MIQERERLRDTISRYREEADRAVRWLLLLTRNEKKYRKLWGGRGYRISLANAKTEARDAYSRISTLIRVSAEVRFDRLSNPHKVVEPIPWKCLVEKLFIVKQPLVNSHRIEDDEFSADQ